MSHPKGKVSGRDIHERICTQSAKRTLSNGVSSPLRRPDAFDIFDQPLGNDSVDFSRLLLSHPVGSIDLGFLEVLALAAHVGRELRVGDRCTHGVVRGVDLAKEFGLAMKHNETKMMRRLTNSTGNSMLPSFLRFSSV